MINIDRQKKERTSTNHMIFALHCIFLRKNAINLCDAEISPRGYLKYISAYMFLTFSDPQYHYYVKQTILMSTTHIKA